jgi:hypothetical protein
MMKPGKEFFAVKSQMFQCSTTGRGPVFPAPDGYLGEERRSAVLQEVIEKIGRLRREIQPG